MKPAADGSAVGEQAEMMAGSKKKTDWFSVNACGVSRVRCKLSLFSCFSMERECDTFTCFQTTSEKEDNRMKNVPVPVYCRPLVEKDPNRKVRRSAAAP